MPPSASLRARQFREFVERGDLPGFEDLWLQTMDAAPADVDAFLAGIDALHAQGNLDKAGLYMSMLVPVLLEQKLHVEALQILRKMAELAPRERGLRHGLLTAYRNLRPDDPRIPSFIEKSGLETAQDLRSAVERMDTFLAYEQGRYVFHPAGWGAGRIVEVDASDGTVVIDFASRRGHRMSLEMAAKVTELLEPDDLRALKLDRLEDLRQQAEDEPLALIRAALRSRRGKATLREVRDRLSGDVIDSKGWSRWWQKARTLIKTAADITMTPGNNPTLELGDAGRGYPQASLRDLALLGTDAQRIRYFRDLMNEASTHEDGPEAVAAVAGVLVGPREDAADMDLGPRISLSLLLKEAADRFPGMRQLPALAPEKVISGAPAVIRALPQIPISGHRLAALQHLRNRAGDEWLSLCQDILLVGEPDSAEHGLAELVRRGRTDLALASMNTVSERYREYPESFLWYLKASLGGKLPSVVPRESPSVLLEKALLLHDHLAVADLKERDEEKRKVSRSLVGIFQSKDYSFIRDAFAHATATEGRNLANLLRNNRSIHRETRDKMLAYMFRTMPELGRLSVEARPEEAIDPLFDPDVLYTTERSLLRKRIEFEDLVNRQIPEGAAEIGRAASYGDLSENSEWSAAVEKQSRLTRQSEELAADIGKARIIDPAIQDGEQVTLGSRVRLRTGEGERHIYTILGPWDVDADRNFISYLSPLGRSLISQRVGDEVVVPTRNGSISYRIEEITDGLAAAEQESPPARKAAPAEAPAPEPD